MLCCVVFAMSLRWKNTDGSVEGTIGRKLYIRVSQGRSVFNADSTDESIM